MKTENIRGRHRAPGRHNPLNELKLLARESAQPAMKGAAIVAATGGILATFAGPASADEAKAANGAVTALGSPAAVGPAAAHAAAPSTALSKIGFQPQVQQAVAQREGVRLHPAPGAEQRADGQGVVVDERGAEQPELVRVGLREPGAAVDRR